MTRINLARGVLLVALAWLSGCATQESSFEREFWLVPGVKTSLPTQACMQQETKTALLTARRDGRVERLLTMDSCRDNVRTLDVLTPTGMALMSISYDGVRLHKKEYVPLPEGLEAAQIMADVLMASLSSTAWESVLPAGYYLKTTKDARTLTAPDGRVIERIDYDGASTVKRLSHEVFGYVIDFRYLKETPQ